MLTARAAERYAEPMIARNRILISAGLVATAVMAIGRTMHAQSDAAPAGLAERPGPQFTEDGQLMAPKDYREWIFLSSGLGMTYGPLSAAGATTENPRFENVFVNLPAYRAFLKTGSWPEHTIFVLEIRSSVSKQSINKDGRVQTDIAGMEAEVKDSKRFPGKWAFFDLSRQVATAKPIAATASCYSCHGQNGAVDNTFVQFYPTLIPTARRVGTFREQAAEVHDAARKSYIFRGKVESVDASAGSLRVNGDKIDGWMDAMTMNYKVDNSAVINKVKTGDSITATVYDSDLVLHNVQVVASKSEIR